MWGRCWPSRDAVRKSDRLAGLDPDKIDDSPKQPDPKWEELLKRVDALVNEERQRLREARRSRGRGRARQ